MSVAFQPPLSVNSRYFDCLYTLSQEDILSGILQHMTSYYAPSHLVFKIWKKCCVGGYPPPLCVCACMYVHVCGGMCTYVQMHVDTICKYEVFSSLTFHTLSRMTDQPSPSCTPPPLPSLPPLCGIMLSYLLVFLHGFWGSELRISCLCGKHFITWIIASALVLDF